MNMKFLWLLILIFWTGCASNKVNVAAEKDPQRLYNFGVEALKNGDYLEATDAFAEIKKRFSQSHFFALSELRTADNEYDQGNFAEAAATYENFVELYPTHPEAAYAQFRRAKSYMQNDPENEARDQSSAAQASAAATQLLNRYPDSKYTKEAREIYYKARFQLAKKEAYVARFYHKKGFLQASEQRWKKIPAEFQDLKDYSPAKNLWKEVELALGGK